MTRGGVSRKRASGWLVGIGIFCVWIFILTITIPQPRWPGNFDYGFFTSIAERLRSGDVLYQDVWDNKDPVIFYSIAVFRSIGVVGAWILELLWIFVTACSIYTIGRVLLLPKSSAAAVGFGLTPIALLGTPYFMGSSHVPGVALTMAAVALSMKNRWVLAGIPLGLLVFTKFVMFPLALAIIIAAALAGRTSSKLWRIAIGAGLTCSLFAIVMHLRGELGGFIGTQFDNILYSQSPIVSAAHSGLGQKFAQHIVILVNANIMAIEVTSLVVIAGAWLTRRRIDTASTSPQFMVLWWATTVAFVGSCITIAVTGKWFHHAEIFVVSSGLVLLLLVITLRFGWNASALVTSLTALVATLLLAGIPSPTRIVNSFSQIQENWQIANEVDPLTQILEPMTPTSVAFVGLGNLTPRSKPLPDWTIACPDIAQRPFNPSSVFERTLSCLPSAQLVVISEDFGRDAAFPAFATFYDQVQELMADRFSCDVDGKFLLCSRN